MQTILCPTWFSPCRSDTIHIDSRDFGLQAHFSFIVYSFYRVFVVVYSPRIVSGGSGILLATGVHVDPLLVE